MEYIQELQFLVGDVELNKEELIVLNSFTDEIVNLKLKQIRIIQEIKICITLFQKFINIIFWFNTLN